jgi:hypothetical protein
VLLTPQPEADQPLRPRGDAVGGMVYAAGLALIATVIV